MAAIGEPARLLPDAREGVLEGGTERYEKQLRELAGLYRSDEAFQRALNDDDGAPVYWVESSIVDRGAGALTIGVSTLEPGRVGREYAMTRGHLHARAECAEMYYGLAGRGVLLMESLDGESRALEITPGVAVHVPGHWVHRSVNVGEERLVTLFCYASDAGQDYGLIEDAGGMATLVVATEDGGWATQANADHRGYRQTVEAAS